MTDMKNTAVAAYYQHIQEEAGLRTAPHAERWSTAVLNTLGLYLGKDEKKELAGALPDELAADLRKKFWLAHFKDADMPRQDFLERVARRSGNTDYQFAAVPTTAVFHNIKILIKQEVSQHVADSLSPDVGGLWQDA